MVNEETPEERLKKYKQRLEKMAQEEGRDSKLVNPVKSEKEVVKRAPPTPQPAPIEAPIGPRPKPPTVLESPAKRELRESQVVKKRREALLKKLDSKGGKSRIMLKARQKAIDNQLQEIKSRKSMLELQYKRKVINRTEYDQRMKLLVEEGRDLLKEKSEIDESLAR
ncbi:MAG: hypothetical protein RTU63_06805 [Candidatus Thorarchaeota archaeon]